MLRKINFLSSLFIILATNITAALPDWYGYVSNIGTTDVNPVNLTTNVEGTTVTVPPIGSGVGISNDGNTAYVCSSTGAGTFVTPIDILTNIAGTPIPVDATGGNGIVLIAMTPNGQKAYVVNPNLGTVTPITLATNTAGTPISTGGPSAASVSIAITPDGSTAYVCNGGTNELIPINLATDTALPAIPLTFSPSGIAIDANSPNGSVAYLTAFDTNQLIPYNLPTQTAGTPIPVATSPLNVYLTPNGSKAYTIHLSNVLTSVDLTSATPTQIPLGGGTAITRNVAINPDGSKLYIQYPVLNQIGILDIATDTFDPTVISTGPSLCMAITPDQAPIAAFTMVSQGVFDASASSSNVGTIATYEWDFGDGQTVVTTSPTINHNYAAPGTYNVTLRVINTAGTSTEYVFTGQTAYQNGGPSAQLTQQITIQPTSTRPLPAANFKGKAIKNRFATQTDLIYKLKWTPSSDPTVTHYILYRNGVLIATIPATGPYQYLDHNRNPKVTDSYNLTAANAANVQSTPLVFVFN